MTTAHLKKGQGSYNTRLGLMLASSGMIMLALGSYYTIGNMTPYMISSYLRNRTSDTELHNVDALWITSVGSLMNGVGTTASGLMYKHFGPRVVTFLGSLIFGTTVMMSSLTIQTSLFFVVISYGVISSLGSSMAYGALVQTAVKCSLFLWPDIMKIYSNFAVYMSSYYLWVPHRPTLAVGTIVAAYGGSSIIFNQVITGFINPNNISPDFTTEDGDRYFTDPRVLDRVPTCFILIGGCYLCMSLFGVLGIQLPVDSDLKNETDSTDLDEFSSSSEASNGEPCKQGGTSSTPADIYRTLIHNTKEQTNNNEQLTYHFDDFINENECLLPRNPKDDLISFDKTPLIYSYKCDGKTIYGSLEGGESTESDQSEYQIIITENITTPKDLTLREAIKEAFTTRAFIILWISMFMYDGAFEFIIGLYKAYGETFIKDDRFLAIVGSVSSIFNCIGRPIWGYVMDRFGYKISMRLMTGGFIITSATIRLIEHSDKSLFLIWICALYFFFCGFLAIAPSTLSKLFGPNNTAMTYGLLLVSQSLASINAAIVGITLKGIIGWHGLFYLATGMASIPFILTFFFNGRDHNGSRF